MNTHRTLAAATLASAALLLGSTPATALPAAQPGATVERERGIVMECTGEAGGLQAYASLYENDRYGNHLQVVLGDVDEGNGRSKRVRRAILRDGTVGASIAIDGSRARITGTASKVGKKTKVREELDDAGYHISSVGTHRRLATALVLTYQGTSVPLTCAPAFAYDLTVTKTPLG